MVAEHWIDPLMYARMLWLQSHALPGPDAGILQVLDA